MGKIISTNTRVTYDEHAPTLDPRGPTTADLDGGRVLSPAQFAMYHATADEWADFKKKIAARVGKEPAWIYEKCGACGYVDKRRPRGTAVAGHACIKCNWPAEEKGGHMRDMKPAEVRAYLKAKAASDATDLARLRAARHHARNEERLTAGLPVLTADQFAAEERDRARAFAKHR